MGHIKGLTSVLYSTSELEEMSHYSVSKTISDSPEVELKPTLFCQPIDIGIELSGDTTNVIKNMTGYPLRSLDNAIAYIHRLIDLGIQTVMIRMNTPASFGDIARILERQATIVQAIKYYDEKQLSIIVDPFSFALNDDKTWGIIRNGKLNYLETAELFADITSRFSQAGATYILTLGRFEREVDIAYRTIKNAGKSVSTLVSSFSTNTETTNAYVYADHGAYAVTKQKILVTNYHEMIFRAIVDIYEGSSLVVVKPAENLHVLEKLKTLIQHAVLLEEFLQSKHVEVMIYQSAYLYRVRSKILADTSAFARKAQTTRLAAYTVSGTYFIDNQTHDRKGDAFLLSVLYERFSNIAATLDDYSNSGLIIDRNAAWFVQNRS